MKFCTPEALTSFLRSLKAGIGPVDDPRQPQFEDLDEAQAWITEQLAATSVGS